MQPLRGTTKMQLVCDGNEVSKLAKLHAESMPGSKPGERSPEPSARQPQAHGAAIRDPRAQLIGIGAK